MSTTSPKVLTPWDDERAAFVAKVVEGLAYRDAGLGCLPDEVWIEPAGADTSLVFSRLVPDVAGGDPERFTTSLLIGPDDGVEAIQEQVTSHLESIVLHELAETIEWEGQLFWAPHPKEGQDD